MKSIYVKCGIAISYQLTSGINFVCFISMYKYRKDSEVDGKLMVYLDAFLVFKLHRLEFELNVFSIGDKVFRFPQNITDE